MKDSIKFLLLFGLLAIFLTGCKDDPVEVDQSEFETLTQYMAQNDLDLPDVLNGWVTSGGGINVDPTDYSVPDYYVIDIRGAADFDAGHIKDAHNVAFTGIIDEAPNAAGKPILVVCYTGQTAARAVGLLRLMGYEAKSLKWGMSSWHSDFAGKWNANAADVTSTNWVKGDTPPANQEFGSPTFVTNDADGASILEARVRAALTMDWAVSKTNVLDNPSNYFINNKWSLASWDAYGHVTGAYRIDEDLNLSGLKYLSPNETVVTYCYTGQTSSITTAWLDVLGYDGRSMLFGANGIVHSDLVAGSAAAKSWKGASSGSENNFGYYDSNGDMHTPL